MAPAKKNRNTVTTSFSLEPQVAKRVEKWPRGLRSEIVNEFLKTVEMKEQVQTIKTLGVYIEGKLRGNTKDQEIIIPDEVVAQANIPRQKRKYTRRSDKPSVMSIKQAQKIIDASKEAHIN